MKDKLIKGTVILVSKLFKSVAFSESASVCAGSFYQPKEPKCLREK